MDPEPPPGGGRDPEGTLITGAQPSDRYSIDYTFSVAFSTRNEVIISSWFTHNADMKQLLKDEISSLPPVSGWICYAEPDWRCFIDCPVVPLVRYGFGKSNPEALRAWCGGEVSEEYMFQYVVPAERHVPLVPKKYSHTGNLYIFENPQIEKYNVCVRCYYKSNLPLMPGEKMYQGMRFYEMNWDLRPNFKILQNGSRRYKQIISMEIIARLWSNIHNTDIVNYINDKNKQIVGEATITSASMQEVLIKLWAHGYCADLRSLLAFDSVSDKYHSISALEKKDDVKVVLPIWQLFVVYIESTLSFFTALYLYLKVRFPADVPRVKHLNEFTAREEVQKLEMKEFEVSQSFMMSLYKNPSVKRFVKNILDKFTFKGLIMPNTTVEQNGLRTALWLLCAAPYILVPLRNAMYQITTRPTNFMAREIWKWFENSYDDKESDTPSNQELKNLASNFPGFCTSVETCLENNRNKSLHAEIMLILKSIWHWRILIRPFPFSKEGPFSNSDKCRCAMRENKSTLQGFIIYAGVFKVSENSYYILDWDHKLVFGVRKQPIAKALRVLLKY